MSLKSRRDGDTNKTFLFDGVNDIITIAQDNFTTTNELNVAFWVNVEGGTGGPTYFAVCSDFGIFQNGMEIGLAISIPGTSSAATPITSDLWHHIAGTYDGTSISMYLIGALMETTTHSGIISDIDRDLTFGFFNTTCREGKIDDFRIYDRVLTAEDLGALLDFED